MNLGEKAVSAAHPEGQSVLRGAPASPDPRRLCSTEHPQASLWVRDLRASRGLSDGDRTLVLPLLCNHYCILFIQKRF